VTELPTFPNPINGKENPAKTVGEPPLPTRSFRHDWDKSEILALLTKPLLELVDQAREGDLGDAGERSAAHRDSSPRV